MEEDIEILNQHLNELYTKRKDGDKTVSALRRLLAYIDRETTKCLKEKQNNETIIRYYADEKLIREEITKCIKY